MNVPLVEYLKEFPGYYKGDAQAYFEFDPDIMAPEYDGPASFRPNRYYKASRETAAMNMLRAGATVQEAAKKCKTTYKQIYAWAATNKVETTQNLNPNAPGAREAMLEMMAEGARPKDIAKTFNTSLHALHKMKKEELMALPALAGATGFDSATGLRRVLILERGGERQVHLFLGTGIETARQVAAALKVEDSWKTPEVKQEIRTLGRVNEINQRPGTFFNENPPTQYHVAVWGDRDGKTQVAAIHSNLPIDRVDFFRKKVVVPSTAEILRFPDDLPVVRDAVPGLTPVSLEPSRIRSIERERIR